jgi:regulator of sigma E protease
MIDFHHLLVTVVAFIVLIGLMVIVHEFGHFAVAKLCKVRVEAFSFGFGPRLFGYKYGDTDYKVCLLPLGGFVKMTGEAPEQNLEAPGTHTEAPTDDPGAFTAHPRWQRMLIGLAGPVANFLLAFALMLFYFSWINEVHDDVKTATVEWVVPGSAAAQAGFQVGDAIRRFETVENPDWSLVETRAVLNLNQSVPVTVDRGGKTLQLSLHLPAEVKGQEFKLDKTGLMLQYLPGPIVVEEVTGNSPAAQAGLRDGDAIAAVDGHVFHTVIPMQSYLQDGKGKPVALTVIRNGATLAPLVAHPAMIDSAWRLGILEADPPGHPQPLPLPAAAAKARQFCADNSFLILEVLQRIFTRKVSASQLAGPVGIARMAGQAAEMKSWSPKFGLAAEISLNLGILNLLPFPILDGGMIFLLLIEGAIRRDIDTNVKERIYQAAFVVLVALFAFIIFNDVTKLPMFTHLKP